MATFAYSKSKLSGVLGQMTYYTKFSSLIMKGYLNYTVSSFVEHRAFTRSSFMYASDFPQ